MSWEALIREGNPTGRMDATLTLTSSTGVTIATYELENAWPTNVDVPAEGTDLSALASRYVSVTPLRLDRTDDEFSQALTVTLK